MEPERGGDDRRTCAFHMVTAERMERLRSDVDKLAADVRTVRVAVEEQRLQTAQLRESVAPWRSALPGLLTSILVAAAAFLAARGGL